MRPLTRILPVSVALAVVLSIASTPVGAANRVKTASGYGAADPNFSVCQKGDPSTTTPCEAFQTLVGAPTKLDGIPVVNAFQFISGPGNTASPGPIFDVFDLGSLASGTLVTFGNHALGVFDCGTNNQIPPDFQSVVSATAFDNQGNFISGLPCTPITDFYTLSQLNAPSISTLDAPTMANNNMPSIFTFSQIGNGIKFDQVPTGDEIVVFDQEGPTVPEPGTSTLLALGLLTVAGLVVRRASHAL